MNEISPADKPQTERNFAHGREVRTFVRGDVPKDLLESPQFAVLARLAAEDWFIIFIAVFAMTRTQSFFYPVYALIIGSRFHSLGILVHDLCHARFKKTFKVRALELATGYWVGNTIEAMAYHHLRHHQHTLLESDPYLKINKKCTSVGKFFLSFKKGVFLIPFWIFRSYFGAFAYFVPSLRTLYGRIFLQDVTKTDLSESADVAQCAKEDIFQAIFHTLLIALTLKFPILIFAYYIPIEVTGIICIYRLLLEHEYEIVKDQSVYSILDCTADHHLGFWGSLLIAPRNVGYHAIHHIHPNVGLHALPKIRSWYLENCHYYESKLKNNA